MSDKSAYNWNHWTVSGIANTISNICNGILSEILKFIHVAHFNQIQYNSIASIAGLAVRFYFDLLAYLIQNSNSIDLRAEHFQGSTK